jgi:hypothetical protein
MRQQEKLFPAAFTSLKKELSCGYPNAREIPGVGLSVGIIIPHNYHHRCMLVQLRY